MYNNQDGLGGNNRSFSQKNLQQYPDLRDRNLRFQNLGRDVLNSAPRERDYQMKNNQYASNPQLMNKIIDNTNVEQLAKVNPIAYDNYMQNLQKQDEFLNKMNSHNQRIIDEQEKLKQATNNVKNVNQLNKMNADLIKMNHKIQSQKIKDNAKPLYRSPFLNAEDLSEYDQLPTDQLDVLDQLSKPLLKQQDNIDQKGNYRGNIKTVDQDYNNELQKNKNYQQQQSTKNQLDNYGSRNLQSQRGQTANNNFQQYPQYQIPPFMMPPPSLNYLPHQLQSQQGSKNGKDKSYDFLKEQIDKQNQQLMLMMNQISEQKGQKNNNRGHTSDKESLYLKQLKDLEKEHEQQNQIEQLKSEFYNMMNQNNNMISQQMALNQMHNPVMNPGMNPYLGAYPLQYGGYPPPPPPNYYGGGYPPPQQQQQYGMKSAEDKKLEAMLKVLIKKKQLEGGDDEDNSDLEEIDETLDDEIDDDEENSKPSKKKKNAKAGNKKANNNSNKKAKGKNQKNAKGGSKNKGGNDNEPDEADGGNDDESEDPYISESEEEGKQVPGSLSKDRKKELGKILRRYFRLYGFANILMNYHMKQELARKEDEQGQFGVMFREAVIPSLDWIVESCKKGYEIIAQKQKVSFDILESDKVKEKVLDERLTFITQILSLIFEELMKNSTDGKVPEDLLKFMATFYTEKSYLPQDFMFEFELDRLTFHVKFGYICDVQPKQTEMMITMLIIIRIMILNVLVKPWDLNFGKEKILNSQINKNKVKTIASILYHVVMNHFRDYLDVQVDNQKELSDELLIRPIKETLPVRFDDQETAPERGTKDRAMTGLFKQEEIEIVFTKKEEWHEQFDIKVEEWMMKMEELVQNYKNKQVKEERRRNKQKNAKEMQKNIPIHIRNVKL